MGDEAPPNPTDTPTDTPPDTSHVTPPSPPAKTASDSNNVTERLDGLTNTVTSLTETVTNLVDKVSNLVDVSPRDDEAPTHVPWTHRGGAKR